MTNRHSGRRTPASRGGARPAAVLAAAAAALIALAFGPAIGPSPHARTGPAMAAEALTCVPLERVEPVPVAGDRHYHRTGGAADGALRYSAAIRDEVYVKGAPIDLALTIRNTGNAPVTLSFATAQRFDAALFDDTCREIWRWSRGRMFAQALGTLTVVPGNIVTYRIRWDQRDQEGRPVRLGAYEARVLFLGKRTPRAMPVVLSPLEFAVR